MRKIFDCENTRPVTGAVIILALVLAAGCEHKQSAKPLNAVAAAQKAQEEKKRIAQQELVINTQGGCLVPESFCTEISGADAAALAAAKSDCETGASNGSRKGTWLTACSHDGATSACKVTDGNKVNVTWFLPKVSAGEALLICNSFGAPPKTKFFDGI